jgi:hypothetical protein
LDNLSARIGVFPTDFREVRNVKIGWLVVIFACAAAGCTSNPPTCGRWNVAGTWNFAQSNGFFITFVLQQRGERLMGTADNGSGAVPLTGTMQGDQFSVTVSWVSGGAGRYTAAMSPSGELVNGFTQNLSMPSSTASWSTQARFKCR